MKRAAARPLFLPVRAHRTFAAALALTAVATSATANATPPDMVLPPLENAGLVLTRAKFSGVQRGIVLEGTVYAVIEINRNGGVKPIDFYGAPMSDPRAATFVRELTDLMVYAPPSAEWKRRHPDGRWAVFWMFQADGCTPPTYLSPPNVTAIRVCVRPIDGKLAYQDAAAHVELPGMPPVSRVVRPKLPIVDCDDGFPRQLRAQAGIGYTATFHAYVDAPGRAIPLLVEETSGVAKIEEMTAECVRRQVWLEPDGKRLAEPGFVRLGWKWSVVTPEEAKALEAAERQ